MTWVYCEPKSRMRILEWAEGAEVFTGYAMTCCSHGPACHAEATRRQVGRVSLSVAPVVATILPAAPEQSEGGWAVLVCEESRRAMQKTIETAFK